jgi:predicted metal-dependent enzyme (double-stranded beta helix superfamily)
MAIAQQAQQSVSVAAMRRAAVAQSVGEIKRVEQAQGVTRESLAEVREILKRLAARAELFPTDDFPIVLDERGQNPIYRLSEDDDRRFALYMSASRGAKKVPPHNHTTWAVIVGVSGEEQNYFYERTDDGATPGRGTLRQVRHETVRPGSGVCMLPEDIHHIETHGEDVTLHLHMYGLALDQLHERVRYDVEQGTYRVFGANQNIRDAR